MKQSIAVTIHSFFLSFFFSLNTFYFYYKYSSVVTKRSICHEDTAKQKECWAHKTGFIHNMWSGMLIIAGLEMERAQARPSRISHLLTPGKQRWGQRSKPLVSASSRTSLIGSLRPHFQNPSFKHPVSFPYSHNFSLFICLTLCILRLGILDFKMVNCNKWKPKQKQQKVYRWEFERWNPPGWSRKGPMLSVNA